MCIPDRYLTEFVVELKHERKTTAKKVNRIAAHSFYAGNDNRQGAKNAKTIMEKSIFFLGVLSVLAVLTFRALASTTRYIRHFFSRLLSGSISCAASGSSG